MTERLYPWEPMYGFSASDRDRVGLAAALEAIRRNLCVYRSVGDDTCDCKYIMHNPILDETETPKGGWRVAAQTKILAGEQTGCPELRSVIHILLHDLKPTTDAIADPDAPKYRFDLQTYLESKLGPDLVSVIGYGDLTLFYAWKAWDALEAATTDENAKMWFVRANEKLNDLLPVVALREGRDDRVWEAALHDAENLDSWT